ncbi:MAG: caspase family protein [Acidimicrobiia bacterium]
MTQGLSVHIGLNRVDPLRYGGWDGKLRGCLNDQREMERLATSIGYTVCARLSDAEATASAVLDAVVGAVSQLQAGDTLLVTYSGHGGQIPDVSSDESDDRFDETWVLYDRMLVDDELRAVWCAAPKGSRILVISDSCHSGTVSRDGAPRSIPRENALINYDANRESYVALRKAATRAGDPEARVALLSGCQDNQVSYDGARHGAFTEALLAVWSDGAFTGQLGDLRKKIVGVLERKQPLGQRQKPNLYVYGGPDDAFDQGSALRLPS